MTNRCERMRGFTLLELLITMVVAAVLLSIAVPAFRGYVLDTRLSTQAETLVYSLNLARSEAVKLDTTVDVCASSNGTTCNSNAWVDGWIVCYPDAACSMGGTTIVLGSSPAVVSGNMVAEVLNNATTVSFSSTGQTGSAYEFAFCDSRGAADGRELEVNPIGRIEAGQAAGQTVAGTALMSCM